MATAALPLPAFMLSARGREGILAGTLARWAATDWPGAPRVVLDPSPGGDPQSRMLNAYRHLLATALAESDAPLLLLLEDDLAFAPDIAARIGAWEPLCSGAIGGFASLYNPGVRELHGAGAWFAAEPSSVYGAQALILARPFAERALAAWPELPGMQSARLAALAAREFPNAPILYHRPSLVQHEASLSAWGAVLHRAADFGGPGA